MTLQQNDPRMTPFFCLLLTIYVPETKQLRRCAVEYDPNSHPDGPGIYDIERWQEPKYREILLALAFFGETQNDEDFVLVDVLLIDLILTRDMALEKVVIE
jgi:hypothetical protein